MLQFIIGTLFGIAFTLVIWAVWDVWCEEKKQMNERQGRFFYD